MTSTARRRRRSLRRGGCVSAPSRRRRPQRWTCSGSWRSASRVDSATTSHGCTRDRLPQTSFGHRARPHDSGSSPAGRSWHQVLQQLLRAPHPTARPCSPATVVHARPVLLRRPRRRPRARRPLGLVDGRCPLQELVHRTPGPAGGLPEIALTASRASREQSEGLSAVGEGGLPHTAPGRGERAVGGDPLASQSTLPTAASQRRSRPFGHRHRNSSHTVRATPSG